MDRKAYAVVSASLGRNQHRQFPVQQIESYAFEANMDVDIDSFSMDIGDPTNAYGYLLNRDCEVRVNIFGSDDRGRFQPVFAGIADTVAKSTDDHTIALAGRDLGSLALSDATPGKYKHVKPKSFIERRAAGVGLTNTRIHAMSEIGTLIQDGSETEWAFWYRVARKREMWMWLGPNGQLVIDKLGYSTAATYSFGRPSRGSAAGWVMPTRVSITKDTSGRVGEVWVYGEDAKTNQVFAARGVDTTIRAWRRLPRKIINSADVKSTADAKKEADLEVFESIVGAFEIEVELHDVGNVVTQNKMARLNIPELELVGTFYIVGVRRAASMEGMVQIVRMRQRTFALSKRAPDDPKIAQPDAARNTPSASIADALVELGSAQGVRWGDSFVRATREFGTANGWDFAVFLGILLAICEKETGFRNVLVGGHTEWMSWAAWQSQYARTPGYNQTRQAFEDTFRNTNKACGPMQLLSQSYKDWADEYGWNGVPKHDQFEGGRWNPDSNIRAAARALIQKLAAPPAANPNEPNSIWLGVARYYGGSSAASQAYMADVRKRFDAKFKALAEGAVAASQASAIQQGTSTTVTVPGHGRLQITESAPDEVKKAINFCIRRLGDPYEWGGAGPYYDCSSFVTAAYAAASPTLRSVLAEPKKGQHGETTYTLFAKGRFPAVHRDALLPGDLLFFSHGGVALPEHVGMFLADGYMIHDPKPGDVVKMSNISEDYYSERWLGARRLVAWYAPGQGST